MCKYNTFVRPFTCVCVQIYAYLCRRKSSQRETGSLRKSPPGTCLTYKECSTPRAGLSLFNNVSFTGCSAFCIYNTFAENPFSRRATTTNPISLGFLCFRRVRRRQHSNDNNLREFGLLSWLFMFLLLPMLLTEIYGALLIFFSGLFVGSFGWCLNVKR